MLESNTKNLRRHLATKALEQAKTQSIEHIGNQSGAVVAIRAAHREVELQTSFGRDTGEFRTQTDYTLSFNDGRADETHSLWEAENVIMDYLSDDSMHFEVNSTIDRWINQAKRECVILAIIDHEILVEYEMPAGTSALLRFTVRNGELVKQANVNYNTCPKRWIKAIRSEGMDWIGMGQRMVRRLPLPA